MWSKTLKIIAITGAILFLYIAHHTYTERSRPFKEIPETLTNFTALKVDGTKTNFSAEKGKATLIVLSASWCPACMAEIPSLKKIHQEYAAKGFKILMVNEDDNLKIAANFTKQQQIPWTVVHWNYDVMNALGNPSVIPVNYLVDSEGNFESIEAGILNEKRMRHAIESILR